jgi:hypothetical protein
MQTPIIDDDAARATARVVEGAITLAKAEIHLAWSEARAIAKEAIVAGALLWLSASVAEVAIGLICMMPLLLTIWDPPLVLLTIALSLTSTVVLGVIGARRMRAAFARPEESPKATPHEAPVVPHTMPLRGL